MSSLNRLIKSVVIGLIVFLFSSLLIIDPVNAKSIIVILNRKSMKQ